MVRQPAWVRASSLSRPHDRPHLDTPHSVGLLWTSDRPVAEISIWPHITITTYRHPWPRRDSNPHPQQASCRRPTPQTARQLDGTIKYPLLKYIRFQSKMILTSLLAIFVTTKHASAVVDCEGCTLLLHLPKSHIEQDTQQLPFYFCPKNPFP